MKTRPGVLALAGLALIGLSIATLKIPSVDAAADYSITYTDCATTNPNVTVGKITIANQGSRAIEEWRLEFNWEQNLRRTEPVTILSHHGHHYCLSGAGVAAVIHPGKSITITLFAQPGAAVTQPRNFTFTDRYAHLAAQDQVWQKYVTQKDAEATAKSLAHLVVYEWQRFESLYPFTLGDKVMVKTPVKDYVAAPYQLVSIPASDGLKLKGLFFPVKNAKGTILALHGYQSNMYEAIKQLKFLLDNGYQVLTYNARFWNYYQTPERYQGHIFTDVKDIGAALAYLKSRPDVERSKIGIYGFSYGAGKTMIAATQYRSDFAAIILDGAPAYAQPKAVVDAYHDAVCELYYGPLGYTAAQWNTFTYSNYIHQITRPLLILQGANDTDVTREEADILYTHANEPKAYWVFPNSGHCNAYYTSDQADYIGKVVGFLRQYLQSPRMDN